MLLLYFLFYDTYLQNNEQKKFHKSCYDARMQIRTKRLNRKKNSANANIN